MQARRPGSSALLWRIALVLAIAGPLGWWIVTQQRSPRTPRVAEVEAPSEPEVRQPQWRPRDRVEPAPGCAPNASRVCLRGDSWWVDSCDVPHALAAECGLGLCTAGACEPEPLPGCGGLPPIGRCEDDIAEVCAAGRPMAVDCGADGRRCVMTEDGPACRDRGDDDCQWPPQATQCEDDTLLACREGTIRRVDCAALDARCVAQGTVARCVGDVPAAAASDACGPCGCDDDASGEEICDGRDNDGDGHIDENGCDPIDIVAFVITDRNGNSSYTEEDLTDELTRINAAFTREDSYGLSFRLAETLWIPEPDLLRTDELEFDTLVDSMAYPPRESFYIPVLFTDEVIIDAIPRPGASTVPNGICGGKRRDPVWHPAIGLVGIAKRRWPTTVAHEIGHFLGLCHTHGDHIDAVQRVTEADGEAIACEERCALEADGICDTPPDPGPTLCAVADACNVACSTGEVPDGRNLMGYYPECRSVFSVQQMLMMRRMLALRRGWHPCVFDDEGCACEPTARDCPHEMTCRSFVGEGDPTWRCGMDGASVPGGTCKDPRDCGGGSICMSVPSGLSLCVRPCTDDTPACTCTELPGNPWPICLEDTARAAPPPP